MNTVTRLPRAAKRAPIPARTNDDLPTPDDPETTSTPCRSSSCSPRSSSVLTAEVALAVVHPGGRQAEVRALGARRAERDAGLQLGVLVEDRLLERGELGARVEAEFRGEELPPATDGGQRIRLSPLAVLREAEDDPSTLAHAALRRPGRAPGRPRRRRSPDCRRASSSDSSAARRISSSRKDSIRAGSQSDSSANGCPRHSARASERACAGAIRLAEFEQLRPAGDEPLELHGVDIDAVRDEPISQRAWSRSSPARSADAVA